MQRAAALAGSLVVAGAGCAQLAGISDTTGDHRKADVLSITRLSVGATQIRAPLDLTNQTASFLVTDPATGQISRLPATSNPLQPGVWTRDLASPAPVEFTLPDEPTPFPRLFALPNQTVSVLYGVLEHPGRTLAPQAATLAINVGLATPMVAGDTFVAYSVGAWSRRDLPAPAAGATQLAVAAYPFSSSTSQSGRATLDAITAQDSFLVLRYTGAALTAVSEATPFDQTGADTPTLPKMTELVADQTLDVKVYPTQVSQRLTAVRPAVTGFMMNWSVVAAPGAIIASNAGPVLHSGAVAATDTMLSQKFANPFVGVHPWPSVVTVATSTARSYTPTGMTLPATLNAGTTQLFEPAPGIDLAQTAGLPILISFAGTQLTTDGQMVARPTGYVEVSFVLDNASATQYSLQVVDLAMPAGGGSVLDRQLIYATFGVEAKFKLRADLFLPGHAYTIRAISQVGGFPGLADADLTMRSLPFGLAFADSAVFSVMP